MEEGPEGERREHGHPGRVGLLADGRYAGQVNHQQKQHHRFPPNVGRPYLGDLVEIGAHTEPEKLGEDDAEGEIDAGVRHIAVADHADAGRTRMDGQGNQRLEEGGDEAREARQDVFHTDWSF